jgi:hypothetical protein
MQMMSSPAGAPRWTQSDPLTTTWKVVGGLRRELELAYGRWSHEAELCEDGRATRLALLPSHGTLYLACTGDLLAVHAVPGTDRYQGYYIPTGSRSLWSEVERVYPGTAPGGEILPRYWLLREPVTAHLDTFAVIDLIDFEVVGRGTHRREVSRYVARMNGPSPPGWQT